jgi:hypothetical protein
VEEGQDDGVTAVGGSGEGAREGKGGEGGRGGGGEVARKVRQQIKAVNSMSCLPETCHCGRAR